MMKKTIAITLAALMLLTLFAGCGQTAEPVPSASATAPTETPAPAETPAETETPAHSPSEDSTPGGVATAEDMTTVEEVVEEGMVPVYAESLVDGVYPVEMKSSSSMFKADHCELVVENGAMNVVLYMTSEAYPYMYAGTAVEAAAAEESDWIALTDGTFTLPLDALDEGESFAAFSKRKELWYDRTLLFRADSLPTEAFVDGFFTTVEGLGLAEDVDYVVEIALSGGSGKASVESPNLLHYVDGQWTALVVWSSPNYDYMLVNGEKYLPVSDAGHNSAFEIPVTILDRPMTVYADTTAMSQPYEIEYTLTFDSASIKAAADNG